MADVATWQAICRRLSEAGLPARQTGPDAVTLDKAVPVHSLPGFEQGDVSVQDAGAQWAARLLDAQPGERVLDACAAPGGKTGHILERADVLLTALDVDAARLARVQENLDRLQLQATLIAGRCCATRFLVGWPTVRPHSGRRAVQCVWRGTPQSRHQVAASPR